MLLKYKDLDQRFDMLKSEDQEGLQSTFTDMFNQVQTVEKANDSLLTENFSLKGQVETLKSSIEGFKSQSRKSEPTSPDFARDNSLNIEKEESIRICAELHVLTKMRSEDKKSLVTYCNKFIDKFFKIYKKLNVKVVSMEILKQEINFE